MTFRATQACHFVGRFQRQQLEVLLIFSSGVRLCVAVRSLAGVGSGWLAFVLFCTYTVGLALEFGGKKLDSPYKLRKCESHGLAQGTLAVPSVLAALAVAAPEHGHWQLWLLASCVAALSTLSTVQGQSTFKLADSASKAAAWKQRLRISTNSFQPMLDSIVGSPRSDEIVLAADQQQHQDNRTHICTSQQQPQPQYSSQQKHLSISPAAVCCLLAIAVGILAHTAYNITSHVSTWLLQLQQQLRSMDASTVWQAPAVPAAVAAAVLVPALYCLVMQLLPGCFSIGEGSLMAQGAAALLAAAAFAVHEAPSFIPPVLCKLLPVQALQAVLHIRGCSSSAHTSALSLGSLPSVIVLVLACTVLICLLLRALLAVLGVTINSHSGNSNIKAPISAQKSRVSQPCNSSSMLSTPGRLLLAVPVAIAIAVMLLWLGCAAVWTLLEFLPAQPGRMLVLVYWVGLLAVTLPALGLWAGRSKVPQIIVRKVYHLLAAGLFVPVFFWDLPLLCLSLAIAFAALVLLEVVRRLQLPVLGQAVQQFMQGFVDERDSGVIYVTHFTLLLGLAVPIWLCLGLPGAQQFAGTQSALILSSDLANVTSHHLQCFSPELTRTGSSSSSINSGCTSAEASPWVNTRLLLTTAGLSGVVIIGVGDTAASMVGKLLGRRPIFVGSRKTVEGTTAGIAASLFAWVLLLWCVRGLAGSWQWWLQLVVATAGAGLLEAVTSQLDNVLLPLWYLPHLMLVRQ